MRPLLSTSKETINSVGHNFKTNYLQQNMSERNVDFYFHVVSQVANCFFPLIDFSTPEQKYRQLDIAIDLVSNDCERDNWFQFFISGCLNACTIDDISNILRLARRCLVVASQVFPYSVLLNAIFKNLNLFNFNNEASIMKSTLVSTVYYCTPRQQFLLFLFFINSHFPQVNWIQVLSEFLDINSTETISNSKKIYDAILNYGLSEEDEQVTITELEPHTCSSYEQIETLILNISYDNVWYKKPLPQELY